MDLFADFRMRTTMLLERLQRSGEVSAGLDHTRIVAGPPRRPGPVQCDIVIGLAAFHAGPHAQDSVAALARHFASDPDVASTTVAAGCVNLVLQPRYLGSVLATALTAGDAFGRGAAKDPMLVSVAGRASEPRGLDPDRAGVLAEAIGSILAFAGHPVTVRLDDVSASSGQGETARIWIRETGSHPGEATTKRSRSVTVKPCRLRQTILRPGSAVSPGAEADIAIDAGSWDAIRFAMLLHRSDLAIGLDLDSVTDQSHAAPLFDVNYAQARARAVLRGVECSWPDLDLAPAALARADFLLLADAGEREIIRAIVRFPHLVALAAERCEPHRVALLLRELAGAVHRQWRTSKDQPQKRFVNEEQRDLTEARLGLMAASALVLTTGLGLFGIKASNEMC